MLEAGLVEGRTLAVDGTLVGANASNQSRVPRERLVEAAQASRTVQECLTELQQQNPVVDQEERSGDRCSRGNWNRVLAENGAMPKGYAPLAAIS